METPKHGASDRDAIDASYHRIERAFCVELGRIVTIDEARLAFVEGSDLAAFHFECSETPCTGLGVRIAGVNYQFDAEQRPKLVANHFRRLDDHASECIYFTPGTDDASPRSNASRKVRALRSDLVEAFLPPRLPPKLAAEPVMPSGVKTGEGRARRPIRNRRRATSSLARLVESYRLLVRSNVPNILRSHLLRVRGHGVLPIAEYIKPVYRATERSFEHVIYGGARWVKEYGTGFKLRFIDRLAGAPVYVYVEPGVLGKRALWNDEIAHLCDGGYCTVYVLGRLQHRPERHTFSIDVASSDHIFIAMPRHPSAPSLLNASTSQTVPNTPSADA
jgi:hypothetical protein